MFAKKFYSTVKLQLAKYYKFFGNSKKNINDAIIHEDLDILKFIVSQESKKMIYLGDEFIQFAIHNNKLDAAKYLYEFRSEYFCYRNSIKQCIIDICSCNKKKNYINIIKWLLPLLDFVPLCYRDKDCADCLLYFAKNCDDLEFYKWMRKYFVNKNFEASLLKII